MNAIILITFVKKHITFSSYLKIIHFFYFSTGIILYVITLKKHVCMKYVINANEIICIAK